MQSLNMFVGVPSMCSNKRLNMFGGVPSMCSNNALTKDINAIVKHVGGVQSMVLSAYFFLIKLYNCKVQI